MDLLKEIEEQFCVKDLYEVLGVDKNADQSAIKKAYRSLSLKHHPDKFQGGDAKIIENQTAKFQLLAKIHKILTDKEKRELYDEQGLILEDESMNNVDWQKYWRLLFPKITSQDIQSYLDEYIGSETEISDLKKIYKMCKGDMNLIYEHMIAFEEDRTRRMLNELIESGELDALPKFENESRASINKRKRKIEKECKEFETQNSDEDLAKAIQMNGARRANMFDTMLVNLEAKYGTKKCSTKKQKFAKKN